VPIADGPITARTLAALAAGFHAKHEQTYGHANRAEPVQLVNLRVTAVGRLPNLLLAQHPNPAAARVRKRDVWFAETGFIETPIHWREGIAVRSVIPGPAIVEAMDSTIVVPPGWAARVDDAGYVHLSRS
jgi:N-methylhydantoinase A